MGDALISNTAKDPCGIELGLPSGGPIIISGGT